MNYVIIDERGQFFTGRYSEAATAGPPPARWTEEYPSAKSYEKLAQAVVAADQVGKWNGTATKVVEGYGFDNERVVYEGKGR